MLLSQLLKIYFGDAGTYFLAAASGLADVDPITLSMSRMSKEGMELDVAARAILIAVSVNSLIKMLFAFFIGGRDLGLRVGGRIGDRNWGRVNQRLILISSYQALSQAAKSCSDAICENDARDTRHFLN